MDYENIKFYDDNTTKDKLVGLVKTYAGSNKLCAVMKREKVNYTKVCTGVKTKFILRRSDIGRLVVEL